MSDGLRQLADDLDQAGAELVGWIACCWVVHDGVAKLQVVASPEARRDAIANLASAQAVLRGANGAPEALQ